MLIFRIVHTLFFPLATKTSIFPSKIYRNDGWIKTFAQYCIYQLEKDLRKGIIYTLSIFTLIPTSMAEHYVLKSCGIFKGKQFFLCKPNAHVLKIFQEIIKEDS